MTRDDLINIGFKELPHFTIGNNLIYDLGRNRQLSITCLGEFNEMVFICGIDEINEKKITDLVCIHNYDYDGFLTIEKIKSLIFGIMGENL